MWLVEGLRRCLGSILALTDDAELERERLTNWGARLPVNPRRYQAPKCC